MNSRNAVVYTCPSKKKKKYTGVGIESWRPNKAGQKKESYKKKQRIEKMWVIIVQDKVNKLRKNKNKAEVDRKNRY